MGEKRRAKTWAKYEKVKARSQAAIEADRKRHEDPHGERQAAQQKPEGKK